MVRTVLQNLVNNAIKFTPAQGAVNVSAKTTSAGTYLVVQDSGVGMGIEQQNRLVMLFANAPSIRDVVLSPHIRRKEA